MSGEVRDDDYTGEWESFMVACGDKVEFRLWLHDGGMEVFRVRGQVRAVWFTQSFPDRKTPWDDG